MGHSRAYGKISRLPPRDATECRGDPDTEGGGIPKARGDIPRRERRYFAISWL